ncbi:LADA_0D08306g1_1 [Lachancea dasiensis]|uniref:THO complex subunit 2 n=1 Tax=Lachancea dasiensis TaxID=1072105 RepID=A0A1G4J6V2_9SACH|nr:LADA_0D08306g1_1 [Lachancea dasiensis]
MSSVCSQINELSEEISGTLFAGETLSHAACENWDTLMRTVSENLSCCANQTDRKHYIKSILYEIFIQLSDHNTERPLDVEKASSLIQQLYAAEGAKTARYFTSLLNSFPERSSRQLKLLQALSYMDDELCTYVIDDKLLEKAGKFTTQQRSLFKRRLVDSRYIIQKYNLLSEHSVAFSELITILLVAHSDPLNLDRAPAYWKEAQCIIGKYSLDPLRSLEVILVVSSQFVTKNYGFLVRFLKASTYWPTVEANVRNADTLNKGGNINVAQSLAMHMNELHPSVQFYDMACVLIIEGMVSFLSVFDNLGPNDETIQSFTTAYYEELEADSMKGISNPLAMASALADDADEDDKPLSSEDGEAGTVEKGVSHVEPEINREETKDHLKEGKLMLLQRLLAHGAVIPFIYAFQTYSRYMFASKDISKLYLRLFEYAIHPVYSLAVPCTEQKKDSNNLARTHDVFQAFHTQTTREFYYQECMAYVTTVDNVDKLFSLSHQWLTPLGPHLAHNASVVSKLCRIGLEDIRSSLQAPATLERWLNFARKFVLPALPLLTENVIVINQAYELLSFFDYERRYFLYHELSSKLSQDNIFIKAAWNASSREAKTELKSLSIDNMDKKGRIFAKIVSKNPLSALEPVMNQLENYDKLSDLVVETTSYFTPFAYDVLQYHILLRLSSERQSLQESGIHVTMWVQRLAVFIASLVKKSPRMDIRNIVRFVVKKLHLNDMISVTVIKELTSKVGGVKDINDLSPRQLLMLNSGKPLQELARSIIRDTRDENYTPALRLLNVFIEENALSEIFILLDSIRVSLTGKDSHYKVVSTRIDDIGLLMWSFIDMSKHFLGADRYKANVIPFDLLVSQYGLSIEWAFFIWRDFYDSLPNDDLKSVENWDQAIERAQLVPVEFQGEFVQLFINFWKSSLYDVSFPKDLYDDEKRSIEKTAAQCKPGKKKREASKMLENIMASRLGHQRAYNRCQSLLQAFSFNVNQLKLKGVLGPFIQRCVIPRALFSPADALYVVNFIWEAFSFSGALMILEEIALQRFLVPLLFSSTSLEASNLGLFFTTYLEKLEQLRKSNQVSNDDLKILFSIHHTIADDVINLMMEKNYMSIRNGIEFMKYLSTVFPVVEYDIFQMIQVMEKLISADKREDILLPSNALIGHLRARLKTSIELEAFYDMNPDEKSHFACEEKDIIIKYYKALASEEEERKRRLNFENETEEKLKEGHQESKNSGLVNDENLTAANVFARFGKVSPLPMYDILGEMRDVCKYLEADRPNYMSRIVRNKFVLAELRQIERETIHRPQEYSSRLSELFESFYRSLVSSPNHDKFQQRLNAISLACKSVRNPQGMEKMHKGKPPAQPIAYDEEPLPKAPSLMKARSETPRGMGQAGDLGDNKRQSRYSGARLNNPVPGNKNKSVTSDDKTISSQSREKIIDERKKNRESSFDFMSSKLPKGPSSSSEGRPVNIKSRYDRNSAAVPEDKGKASSPAPRVPARGTAVNRTGTDAASRFQNSPASESRFPERPPSQGLKTRFTKRPRDEVASPFPSKRKKNEPSRSHFPGPERERPASSVNRDSNTGDRYERKPLNDKRQAGPDVSLPSGPRSQGTRDKRGRGSSHAQPSTPAQRPSRYQK